MNEESLKRLITDKEYRMRTLYKIVDKNAEQITFKKNKVQEHFNKNKAKRNIMVKSRQHGVTTDEAVDSLDDVLFSKNFEALFVAHTQDAALEIFNKKINYAWGSLDKELSSLWKVEAESANKLKFNFGDGTFSAITVANSGRSGTYNRVHISEFAKLCATYPKRALEIITGTIPSVPLGGRIDIESTAEGMGGYFSDMWWEAWNRGEPKHETEFKAHFYNWQWDEEEIAKVKIIPVDEMEQSEKFREYQILYKLTDREISYYYLKWLSLTKDWSLLRQEYPTTCVVGETLVDTIYGLQKIEDVIPDGDKITHKYNQGEKEVFELITKNGYSVEATADHRIKTAGGFVELKDLSVGDSVLLGEPSFGNKNQTLNYYAKPFLKSSIIITKDFGRFLGYFMGDGSFYGSKGTISIACDRQCPDVIADISRLMRKFFGEPRERITGDKNGCVEVRTSSKEFIKPFNELGLLYKNDNGKGVYKRKIHVPDIIKSSPREVVKQFLIGLFEADGFVDRTGNRVIFFTKYEQFAKELQVLLLGFGTTCRLRKAIKKSGGGHEYVGYELIFRKQESISFQKNLGFVSKKKVDRLNQKRREGTNFLDMTMDDEIVSIKSKGSKQVWDITTKTREFIANGIVVHNCEEAFILSGTPYFDNDSLFTLLQKAPEPTEMAEIELIDNQPIITPKSDGSLKIWSQPQRGRSYVIGGDVAEGIEGGDYSVLNVIDNQTLKTVAKYKARNSPDEFAKIAFALGTWYNNAYTGIEVNKDGLWVNTELFKMGYPNLYFREQLDDITNTVGRKVGFKTDEKTRPYILSELRKMLNQHSNIWSNKDFLTECLTFVRNPKGRPEAASGKHDDEVMATSIAYEIRRNAPEAFEETEIEDDGGASDYVKARLHKLYGNKKKDMISQDDYL